MTFVFLSFVGRRTTTRSTTTRLRSSPPTVTTSGRELLHFRYRRYRPHSAPFRFRPASRRKPTAWSAVSSRGNTVSTPTRWRSAMPSRQPEVEIVRQPATETACQPRRDPPTSRSTRTFRGSGRARWRRFHRHRKFTRPSAELRTRSVASLPASLPVSPVVERLNFR